MVAVGPQQAIEAEEWKTWWASNGLWEGETVAAGKLVGHADMGIVVAAAGQPMVMVHQEAVVTAPGIQIETSKALAEWGQLLEHPADAQQLSDAEGTIREAGHGLERELEIAAGVDAAWEVANSMAAEVVQVAVVGIAQHLGTFAADRLEEVDMEVPI